MDNFDVIMQEVEQRQCVEYYADAPLLWLSYKDYRDWFWKTVDSGYEAHYFRISNEQDWVEVDPTAPYDVVYLVPIQHFEGWPSS